jgi:hypothetical protein
MSAPPSALRLSSSTTVYRVVKIPKMTSLVAPVKARPRGASPYGGPLGLSPLWGRGHV